MDQQGLSHQRILSEFFLQNLTKVMSFPCPYSGAQLIRISVNGVLATMTKYCGRNKKHMHCINSNGGSNNSKHNLAAILF